MLFVDDLLDDSSTYTKECCNFWLRQAFLFQPTLVRYNLIGIATLNGRLHPPVNQHQQANARQQE